MYTQCYFITKSLCYWTRAFHDSTKLTMMCWLSPPWRGSWWKLPIYSLSNIFRIPYDLCIYRQRPCSINLDTEIYRDCLHLLHWSKPLCMNRSIKMKVPRYRISMKHPGDERELERMGSRCCSPKICFLRTEVRRNYTVETNCLERLFIDLSVGEWAKI